MTTTTRKAGKAAAARADRPMTGRDFDRLDDAAKERIYRECEAITPGSGRPLNTAERRRLGRVQATLRRKRGRPAVGRGAARVQISVERGLLKRADAVARAGGLSRSEFIARSLEAALKASA